MKTEHSGAKNGGGFWGPREDAKNMSRIARRAQDRIVSRVESWDDFIYDEWSVRWPLMHGK